MKTIIGKGGSTILASVLIVFAVPVAGAPVQQVGAGTDIFHNDALLNKPAPVLAAPAATASPEPTNSVNSPSNVAPDPGSTVLHTKTRLVPIKAGTVEASSTESWFDTATHQGRLDQVTVGPSMHVVTVYDAHSTLRLDPDRKVSQVFSALPADGAPAWGEKEYKDRIASGRYIYMAREQHNGRDSIKVRLKLERASDFQDWEPSTSNYSIYWFDANTYLPLEYRSCELDGSTGKLTEGYGVIWDVAEWLPRSSLAADFFEQKVPEGFAPGSVFK